MRSLIIPTLSLLFVNAFAQTDVIKTDNGELKLHPVFHSAMVLGWNGKTIYIDPYSGAKRFEGLAKPNLVLITDIHQDHLDKETLAELQTAGSTFIVSKAVSEQMGDIKSKEVIVMNNGDKKSWEGIGIEAIPMYNLPEAADAFHTNGRGNGYVLTIGGKRIYISGDTEDIPEMRALKNIDVAFVCMNLPYTMDINHAADGVLAFKPKIVYPFHYRNGDGSFSDIAKFKELVNTKDPNIDVRIRNWYPE